MCKPAFIPLLDSNPLTLIRFYFRVAQMRVCSQGASEDSSSLTVVEACRFWAGAGGCVLGCPRLHVCSPQRWWIWVHAVERSDTLCTLHRSARTCWGWLDLFGMRLGGLSGLCSETSAFRTCMIWVDWRLKWSFEIHSSSFTVMDST